MPFNLTFSKRNDGELENHYTLKVRLLDHTVTDVILSVNAKGKECLEKLSRVLSLQEISYFGLQYINKRHQLRWINPEKPLKHQLNKYGMKTSKEMPLSVAFRVQLYVDNCHKLKQEITRYFYYLQLKENITTGILKCGLDTALRLAAYAVQAEFGDHDQDIHTIEFLQDFVLLPKRFSGMFTPEELNLKIAALHQKNLGMSPAAAEVAYITECEQLDSYGVEHHLAKDKEGVQIMIVPSFVGIRIEHDNGLPPVYFKWPDISRMAYNRQYFCIESTANTATVQFETRDSDTAKYIWRMCVVQHQFFRLVNDPANANSKGGRELLTDTALSLKCRESPTFQRRLTLSRKKIKEQSSAREETDSGPPVVGIFNSAFVDFGSFRSTNEGSQNGFTTRVEGGRTSATGSIGSSVSSRLTAASSGYNSSDSDVEGSIDYSRTQPIARNSLFTTYSNGSSRSPSPNPRRRFMKQDFPTRDQLLKQLERVIEDNEMYSEFEQVFTRKLNCNLSTATLSINSERNRSKEVLPYEENRVILDSNNNPFHNDYINASFIKMDIIRSKSLAFIATQGPLDNTINDFWQMVWEQSVAVIAMVTREVENDSVRCNRYWPEDDVGAKSQFGNFEIVLQNLTRTVGSVTRTFKVTLKNKKKSKTESRIVVQVQYIKWPDNGVPENVADFVAFLEEMRSLQKSAKEITQLAHPQTVIHCSAGAGRTGIVILCEVIISLIENNQPIDVGMTLAKLRTQRMHLVQAANQYRFVYLVLVKYLQRNRLI